jgi:membrane-associated phospholipid phosphatase
MKILTFLGNENFFFLILPMLYWSIDAGLGLRVAFILIVSNALNPIGKFLFAGPRPYWVSSGVEPFSVEHTFGAPSAHAQNSAALWGTVAAWINKPWAWVTAIVVAVLVGISRLYLGMHFVHDVVIGWLIGYVLLFLFTKFWEPAAAWLRSKTLNQQILIAFVLSLVIIGAGLLSHLPLNDYVFPAEWEANALRAGSLPTPDSVENLFTSAGTLFGLAAGLAWIISRGGYETSGSVEQRALRYVIGLIGVMLFWEGLGALFPRGETWLPLLLRYLRYTLVGIWIAAGAPWLFFHFKLARKPKM